MALIRLWLGPAEHSSLVVCGDYTTDPDSSCKEQASRPQPVPRDHTQAGTLSGPEPSQSDREHSPHHLTGGTVDGSRADCRGSLYPSNHDRMPASLKKKPTAPLDGKGRCSVSSRQVGGGRAAARLEALTCPLLSHRGVFLDFSKVV